MSGKTRAWEHPIQAVGEAVSSSCPPGTGMLGWGGQVCGERGKRVLALHLEAGASPGFLVHVRLFPLKPVLSLGLHAREAQTFDLYAKKVQKQLEYKSFGNIRPSVQVHLGNL